ncbi:SDR family oxidoreductase [Halorubrum cibi]|uniref:3-oxoacyl-[acyl-carrier protein] reductase n=1 Tax=Halorubrum cibi TaxID=413815 RepID=A0A521BU72_9EURY|nr:SDR family oxidoreductase [Halorubrum cibi]SMO50703.1 3-oxoacyl-[acyl-carrier protein] reductase [Halorubrum cibi]
MDLNLDGDAALVTASSSGLGRASAKALAREGADVLVNGRDPERLARAVEEVESVATGDVVGQTADITEKDEVEGLVTRAIDEFGRLDHLVTSAGGPPPFRPLETDDEEWYRAYDLLVMSVVRAVRAAAPHLRADGGGTIVNIASRTVKEAAPSNVLSSSVRMGVIGLEKTLSTELAPEVRTNAVLPGSHETPRIEELIEYAVDRGELESYEAGVEARTEGVPLDRLGDPKELGDLVAYLSSPRSSFLNGQAVTIDGGAGSSTL